MTSLSQEGSVKNASGVLAEWMSASDYIERHYLAFFVVLILLLLVCTAVIVMELNSRRRKNDVPRPDWMRQRPHAVGSGESVEQVKPARAEAVRNDLNPEFRLPSSAVGFGRRTGPIMLIIGVFLMCVNLATVLFLGTRAGNSQKQVDELSKMLVSTDANYRALQQRSAKLETDLRETDARLQVTTEELSKSLGLTQKQVESRAKEILQRQALQEANTLDLKKAQQQTAQQMSAVYADVSKMTSDVGNVRTDLGKTQNVLTSAMSDLQSMKGDLSDTNSLIARNHEELLLLERKGDRKIYEFTLTRGQKGPVGTGGPALLKPDDQFACPVSLLLKRTDVKKSKFTLLIQTDERVYEKKDRNIYEPLQFFESNSGKGAVPCEIVMNSINAETAAGYLSAPTGASKAAGR